MRIILVFFIGFLSFFYLAQFLHHLIKGFRYSIFGMILAFLGLLTGFFGKIILGDGINVLVAFFLIGSGLGLIIHHLLSQRFILFERTEREFVLKHENIFERLLEILPGLLTWIALTSPIWLSFTLPYAVAYLILIADVYWLLTALRIGVLIIIGFKKMEWAKKQDWLKLLKNDYPKDFSRYYHLILVPTYKESLHVLGPTLDAIVNCNYPKNKILLAVGFEERDDPKKIKETEKYLKKIKREIPGVFTTIHPYGLSGEVSGQGSIKN